MSSLIEKAAERLEQLRRAGITVPEVEDPRQSPAADPPAPAASVEPAAAPPVQAPPVAEAAPPTKVKVAPEFAPRRIELDLDRIAASGIVTPNAPRSRLADQYRVIKRPLISNAAGRNAASVKHGNLIMVTSAVAGEGKSFTSVNLAMSIAAELDHTVMLVDADVARPSLPRMLGLPEERGLLDILERKVDTAGALMRTSVEKLTILNAGTPRPHATELLASDAMNELLDELASRYTDRIIIFDSPPLLLTTEARVLAAHMGQIVVVVRADSTLQSVVQQALQTIEACPIKLMLLNQARAGTPGGYGYGYSQGYGYGSDSSADAATGD
ncbi:MAG: XrtA-associated tyrosine autokinase [Rubrivivax sp.]